MQTERDWVARLARLRAHQTTHELLTDPSYENAPRALRHEAFTLVYNKEADQLFARFQAAVVCPDKLSMLQQVAGLCVISNYNHVLFQLFAVLPDTHYLKWFAKFSLADRTNEHVRLLIAALYQTERLGGCCLPGGLGFKPGQLAEFCQHYHLAYKRGKYNKYMLTNETFTQDRDLEDFTGGDRYKPGYAYSSVLYREVDEILVKSAAKT